MNPRRNSGFTLVEIIVVLSVSAVVAGITMAGFSSIRNSNRKISCQTNLTQIYQAVRLYTQDVGGPPYFNVGPVNDDAETGGIGLWALYTFPARTASSTPDPVGDLTEYNKTDVKGNFPVASYIRNSSALHCPEDNYDFDGAGPRVRSNQLYAMDTDTTRVLNPRYLSYQTEEKNSSGTTLYYTYSSFRESGAKRQLVYFEDGKPENTNLRPPPDTTVLTWCRFHRKLDGSNGATRPGRNYDNVLFYDGSIQWLPAEQAVSDSEIGSGGSWTGTCTGWQRVPRGLVNRVELDADGVCQPK